MATSINTILTALLDGVAAGFAAAQVTLPTLQYVAPGIAVAYDTDQVTTNLLRIGPGRPGQEPGYQYPLEQVFMAELQVAIIRPVSVVDENGAPPALKSLQADANTFLTDAETLLDVLIDLVNTDAIVPRGVPCTVTGVTPYGPSGGIVGTIGVVAVQLV